MTGNHKTKTMTGNYRWYVLVILGMTYAFSFMDRQIVSILMEDLKAEFSLSDTQLGLLSGLAFAMFYATLGIPIARLADRHNRINIIGISVGAWSIMTAACGMANNFWQLFLARIGVGIGEAGGGPPSHSVISDYFGPHERSFAISVYSLGPPIGMLLGLVAGGFIAEHYGWRMAFFCAGLPGLLLALAVKMTLREPIRGAMEIDSGAKNSAPVKESFKASTKALFQNAIYRRVNIAHMLAVFTAYGLTVWKPAFYLRQFDLSQSEVGLVVGIMAAVVGVPGMLLGGYVADRLSKRDRRWPAWLASISTLGAMPFYFAALWASDWITTTVLFGTGLFIYQLSHAPGLAIVQTVVEPHRRAQAAAYVFFLANMVGLGLGPLLVGYISDATSAQFQEDSLSVALSVTVMALLLASISYFRAATAMTEEDTEEADTATA